MTELDKRPSGELEYPRRGAVCNLLCECKDVVVDRNDEVVGSIASGIDIVVARREDIPEVARMLSAASRRAAALGYKQWWDPFPVEVVEDSLARGETYLAIENGLVRGTMALCWEDPKFWGERPSDAGYVHRICTNPDAARGLGVELLTWAQITVVNRGRDWLRLDTPASNLRLRAYYEALGFLFQDEIDVVLNGVDGEAEVWRAALYERRTQADR
jgi:ribosomal protein S18 acetylase RimI-like enzyme